MAYVTPEEIRQAKEMDLLTYLQNYEPQELVRIAPNTYCTREHDSLKISNGKWHWFSRGIGGRTALDYLIKVKEYPFTQAVETLIGRTAAMPPVFHAPKPEIPRTLLMPELNSNTNAVVKYLMGRGIHPAVIDYCLTHRLLFESRQYHNCVFVGYDLEEKARYAALRGTMGSYKGEVTGSDKRYSFSITENHSTETVHLFESAIDLMSYATLEILAGRDWKQDALLSLAGVYKTKREGVVPVALSRFLTDFTGIKTLKLHLDSDEIGRGAAKGIMDGLKDKYEIFNEPPRFGKDMNALLQMRLSLYHQKEEKALQKNEREKEDHAR